MKKAALSVLFILSFTLLPAQTPTPEGGLVNWLTFSEAQAKNKQLSKPFLVDIYTDWCGWCKHMMKTTYSNPGLAAYINQNFYPVKFDAETKDTIEYNGKIYKPLSKDPRTPHELAVKFLGNSLSYPSTIFITNNFEFNMLAQGFLEDKKLEPMLVFMVENAWQTTVFDEFNKHFVHAFYDTAYPKIAVKTQVIQDLEKLQKKKSKKVLVTIGAGFCNSGIVMNRTSFSDTAVGALVNKYFHLVHFDVTTTDTIIFKQEKHYNTLVNNFPMHTLGLNLSANRFSLPALCILDEELNTIDVLNYYQSPARLKPILAFIGTNAFKKQSFDAFMKTYTAPPQKKVN